MVKWVKFLLPILLVSLQSVTAQILDLPILGDLPILDDIVVNVLDFVGELRTDILNTTELAASFGFVAEEHTVTTEDGYILTIFHILGRNCSTYFDIPVVLFHGVLQNSDNWVLSGPNAALSLLLADSCYSLWLANHRGNAYGQRHVTLDFEQDEEFWDFSYDEIGIFDNTAIIDYVLAQTGADSVNYLGFSLSAASFIPMCSRRPEYCDGTKVKLYMAIAPAGYIQNMTSPFKLFIKSVSLNPQLSKWLGVHKLFQRGYFTQDLLSTVCSVPVISTAICPGIIEFLDSNSVDSMSAETKKIVYDYFPDAASVRTFIKFNQALDGFLGFFDFADEQRNIAEYGTSTPPSYNFGNVQLPAVVIRGLLDSAVDASDVLRFSQELPNLLALEDIADWTHFDNICSDDVPTKLLPIVNKYLTLFRDSF